MKLHSHFIAGVITLTIAGCGKPTYIASVQKNTQSGVCRHVTIENDNAIRSMGLGETTPCTEGFHESLKIKNVDINPTNPSLCNYEVVTGKFESTTIIEPCLPENYANYGKVDQK